MILLQYLLLITFGLIDIPITISQVHRIVKPLSSNKGDLTFSPSRLSQKDVATIILTIFSKYMLKLIGIHPKLVLSSNQKDYILPELSLAGPLLVDSSDIDRFNDALENEKGPGSNHSPLVLAATTTPMMLMLLANRRCPVLPFGSVNTKNRFEFVNPIACRNVTTLKHASVFACLGGPKLLARRVKRGIEFDIIVEVRHGSDAATEPTTVVFRQIITILQFLPADKQGQSTQNNMPPSERAEKMFETLTSHIVLRSDAPRRWVAVCHDNNPIHTSSLMAKLFGFRGKIAHGNHVVAFVVEKSRSGGCGEAFRDLCWTSGDPFFLEVAFKYPMVLPINLEVRHEKVERSPDLKTFIFEVIKDERLYISGSAGIGLE